MIETQIMEGLIELRMIGRITGEDWDKVAAAFEQALGAELNLHLRHHGSGTLSVLMDWQSMGYQDLVGRIAVVGSDEWRGEADRLADVYKFARTRYFQPSAHSEALAWLEGR
jgi:hypothetical protein